jgi:hypothetical protein
MCARNDKPGSADTLTHSRPDTADPPGMRVRNDNPGSADTLTDSRPDTADRPGMCTPNDNRDCRRSAADRADLGDAA